VNIRRLANPAFLAAFFVMGSAAIGMQAALDHFKIYLQKKPIYPEPIAGQDRVLRALPLETANWKRIGQDRIEEAETLEVLGTNNYVTRTYIEKNPAPGAEPRRVDLHLAYYTGMIDTVPHVPDRCLVGGGMSLVGGPWMEPLPIGTSDWVRVPDGENPFLPASLYTTRLSNEWSTAGGGRRVNLPIGVGPETLPLLRVTEFAGPGGGKIFAGYFFIANGGIADSAEKVRGLAFDLKNDYAFYLKVQVGPSRAENSKELAELAGSLLTDLFGEIMTCVPDWTKVQNGHWPPDNPKASTASIRTP
jgi:hypothetical protein